MLCVWCMFGFSGRRLGLGCTREKTLLVYFVLRVMSVCVRAYIPACATPVVFGMQVTHGELTLYVIASNETEQQEWISLLRQCEC